MSHALVSIAAPIAADSVTAARGSSGSHRNRASGPRLGRITVVVLDGNLDTRQRTSD